MLNLIISSMNIRSVNFITIFSFLWAMGTLLKTFYVKTWKILIIQFSFPDSLFDSVFLFLVVGQSVAVHPREEGESETVSVWTRPDDIHTSHK